ncbi:MAG: Na+/H+ antiporter subunit E [Clostridia bacterium]|nr:Na+/H+ antiporter subunit E [Clostridia bacterium]
MLFLLLYLLWVFFNAHVTVEILLIGLLAVGCVWLLSLRMLDLTPGADFRRLRFLPRAVGYLFYLLKEVILAALSVMRRIWTPGQPDSSLADFDSSLKTNMGRIILADSITLTPGTITVESEEGHFQVHCLEQASGQDLDSNEMLRRVRRLEGGQA